ncbi:hypothetical protein NHX12_000958 [Muraenolepis orangiensis]|uniref:non-specific serine/threonine protein kinase n=1 Tax=Muraenolepis orangiensis TaxID=630683 RepID=A0A9Q0IEH3_9TELE|nr:hypothetical protein NHX12_000958 [Muraenolepis orangiensis]
MPRFQEQEADWLSHATTAPDRLVAKRYGVMQMLGCGSFGRVYLVTDSRAGNGEQLALLSSLFSSALQCSPLFSVLICPAVLSSVLICPAMLSSLLCSHLPCSALLSSLFSSALQCSPLFSSALQCSPLFSVLICPAVLSSLLCSHLPCSALLSSLFSSALQCSPLFSSALQCSPLFSVLICPAVLSSLLCSHLPCSALLSSLFSSALQCSPLFSPLLSFFTSLLKVLKEIPLGDLRPNETVQASQEAQLLSRLHHPHILRFFHSFLEHDTFCIITEYCQDKDLDYKLGEVRESGHSLSESQVVDWLVQLLLGVHYMHDRRVLHRDLKAKNVFLKRNLIKIGDFGVSCLLMGSCDLATTFTGTLYYMSPEVLNHHGYDCKSDIW